MTALYAWMVRRDLMIHRHLRPEIERLFGLGGEPNLDRAGVDHLCVEDDVGVWMCDVAHM
jgi:hypothetical protein